MNKFHSLYNNIIKENKITLINEQNIINELKTRLIIDGITPIEEDLIEVSKACMELHEEAKWWQHGIAHVAGAIDPSGLIDAGHAIYYWKHGQKWSGILTLIGAIPYIGDTAKLLIPAFKAGKTATPLTISATKMLINKMPAIQTGLTKLINIMMKSKTMRRVLIKTFGTPQNIAINATKGGTGFIKASAPNMANHIVNKIINLFDGALRKFAGPKVLKYSKDGIRGAGRIRDALGMSAAKGLAYNADFSEIPFLQKYSTAPKDKKFDSEVSAMRKFINDNPYSPTPAPRPISEPTKPKKKSSIDLGSL